MDQSLPSAHSKHILYQSTKLIKPHAENTSKPKMSSLPRPPAVYPQSVKAQYAPSSRGSFTPVYVVLGIIGALTLAACFVGRLLARRCLRPRRDKAYVAEGEIGMVAPAVNFGPGAGAGAGLGGIKQQLMKHSGSDPQESAQAGTGRRGNFGAFVEAPGHV